MSHTPEPWAVSDSPYGAIISTASRELRQSWCVSTEDTGRKYSAEIAVANARRIVACVNACQGMKTNHLRGAAIILNEGHIAARDAAGEYTARIEKERDTYRAMCVELLETTMKLRFISGRTTTAIDESITKAEKLLGGLK